MATSSLKIVLEKPFYRPGEIVTGQLFVEMNPAYCRKITLCLSGKAFAYHRQVTGEGLGNPPVVSYSWVKRATFTEESLIVWRADSDAGSHVELAAGHRMNEFTFHLPLPLDIPPSYEDHDRKIIYHILARVSSTDVRYRTLSNTFTLNVKSSVTFANLDGFLLPRRYEKVIMVSTCIPCRPNGPVITSLDIPRTGFCLGELITFTANVTNNGPTPVQLFAKLTYEETFGHTMKSIDAIVNSRKFQNRECFTWNGAIPIPMDSRQTLLNNRGVRSEYKLKFWMTCCTPLAWLLLPVGWDSSYDIEVIPIVVADATGENRAQISQLVCVQAPPGPVSVQIPTAPAPMPAVGGVQVPAANPLAQFGTIPGHLQQGENDSELGPSAPTFAEAYQRAAATSTGGPPVPLVLEDDSEPPSYEEVMAANAHTPDR